jgi:hypothetical protein
MIEAHAHLAYRSRHARLVHAVATRAAGRAPRALKRGPGAEAPAAAPSEMY